MSETNFVGTNLQFSNEYFALISVRTCADSMIVFVVIIVSVDSNKIVIIVSVVIFFGVVMSALAVLVRAVSAECGDLDCLMCIVGDQSGNVDMIRSS